MDEDLERTTYYKVLCGKKIASTKVTNTYTRSLTPSTYGDDDTRDYETINSIDYGDYTYIETESENSVIVKHNIKHKIVKCLGHTSHCMKRPRKDFIKRRK